MKFNKIFKINVNNEIINFHNIILVKNNTEAYLSANYKYKILIHPEYKICLFNLMRDDIYIDLTNLLNLKSNSLDKVMEEICNNHNIEIYLNKLNDDYIIYDYNMNLLNNNEITSNHLLNGEYKYINITINDIKFEFYPKYINSQYELIGTNQDFKIGCIIRYENNDFILHLMRNGLQYKTNLNIESILEFIDLNLSLPIDINDFISKSENNINSNTNSNNDINKNDFMNVKINKKMLKGVDEVRMHVIINPNTEYFKKKSKYRYYKGIPIIKNKDMNMKNIINSINKIINDEFIYDKLSDLNKDEYYDNCKNKISDLLNVNKYSLVKQGEFYLNIDKLIDKAFVYHTNKLL